MGKKILILFIMIRCLILSNIFQEKLFPPGYMILGVNKEKAAYFFIEPNWRIVEDPIISLDLAASQLTLDDQSTLTFLINGKPISSYKFPKEENNERKLKLNITIPKNYLKEGANEFLIKKFQRLTTECSLDEVNPTNWLKVDNSIISLKYEKDNSNIDLGMLPIPLANKYFTNSNKIIWIAVHKDINSMEKVALANLSLNLGRLTKGSSTKIQIVELEDSSELEVDYAIISHFERLPENFKSIFTPKEREGLKTGRVLKLINNPKNPKSKILIYTGTKEFLGKGFLNILENNRMKFVKGNYIIVPNEVVEENIEEERLSLNSLGIDTINFKDIGENKNSFILELPKGKEINSLGFNVKYLASNLINSNQSTLGVSINGKNVKDTIIKSDDIISQFTVQIPTNELKKPKLYIEFFANLVGKKDCFTPPTPWLTILGESEFKGEYKDKTLFNLGDFPAPFIKDNKFNKLGISVASDKESLRFFSELFKYLGSELKKVSKVYYIENEEDFENLNTAIIIGTPLTNNIIKNNEKKLFMTYSDDKSKFLTTKTVQLLADNMYTGLQLIQDSGKAELYIFTDENKYYDNILNVLKERSAKGDAYLGIGSENGEDYYIEVKETKEIEQNAYYGRVKIGVMVLIIVLIVFGILIFYFKKKIDDEK